MGNVLVSIGEALIDFIPDKSGCDFDEIEAFSPKIGGAPANVCAAFSRLGGRSRLLTQLGNDGFGRKIIHRLDEVGVDTDCITITDKAGTALAFVTLDKSGDRSFSFYRSPSADMLYPPEAVREEYFDDAFALHFCSVSIGDFPMREAHRRAIDIMKQRGGIISFDPNLRFNLWSSKDALKAAVREFIPLSDIVKLSEDEIEFITDRTDTKSAAQWLFDRGVKLVLYTCGSKGAYAITKNKCVYAATKTVEAVDTTGAGDGFTGAFLWGLKRSGEVTPDALSSADEVRLFKCLEFANKFCAISVTKKGAIASYPTFEEMQKINL